MSLILEHQIVWEAEHGPIPKDKHGDTFHIHHLDKNPNNNSIDNLICLSHEDHIKLHKFFNDKGASLLEASSNSKARKREDKEQTKKVINPWAWYKL